MEVDVQPNDAQIRESIPTNDLLRLQAPIHYHLNADTLCKHREARAHFALYQWTGVWQMMHQQSLMPVSEMQNLEENPLNVALFYD